MTGQDSAKNHNIPDAHASVMTPDYNVGDGELRGLVKYLISNIGHPVGMGVEPTDKQADTIILLVRNHDSIGDI